MDQFWQYPEPRAFFSALGGFARVAVYDKPGTGASDPVEATPTIEVRIEQLVAVMDAAGLQRPTVIATSEGGVTGCLVAAARPERVERVILLIATAGGFDRRAHGEMTDGEFQGWLAFIHRPPSTGVSTVIAGCRASPTPTPPGKAAARLCNTHGRASPHLGPGVRAHALGRARGDPPVDAGAAAHG